MSSSKAVLAAVVLAGTLIAGCGHQKDEVAPAACLLSDRGYLQALERAPAAVRLGGTTAISDCLVPEQDGGQLANIGQEMVVAATKLNKEARAEPGGPAALRLGYLAGALSKGADPIHADLVRRVDSAARFSATGGTLPASFQRAFGRGYVAGRATG